MSQANDDYRNLSGMQKAAIFMLAIGNEHSAQLFAKMDEQEIVDLSAAMATLGEVNADVVERLFVEFADQLSSAGGLIGTMSSTERLLLSALDPDQTRSRRSWKTCAAPLVGPCGTSSATSTRRC